MLDHSEDMPILNMILGRSSTAAPLPKPLVKRWASPLKEPPARDEEDETSDCPMEQVADENPSASQQPENVNMEQVDYDPDSDDNHDSNEEPAGRPTSKAMPHPKLAPKSPPPALRLVPKVKPAPKNILDEETEFDNHPGDRPALPRRNPYTQDLSEIQSSSILCTNTARSAQPSSRSIRTSTSFLSMNDHMESRYSG